MLPRSVDYYRATSVADAKAKLSANPDAKILAGGHSLVPAMKLRLNSPTMVIDIANLNELNYIKEADGNICIGAMTTHAQISKSTLLQEKLPILHQTADVIGDAQVRNVGTIGGSIAHADPSADWPATLMALDAVVITDSREISVGDFFQGFFSTSLEENEIITEIRVPLPKAGTKTSYQKFMQPASRFAIVGCAAVVTTENGQITAAKVAFTGVSDGVFRDSAVENALVGKASNDDVAEEAALLAAEDIDILSDHYASEDYRKHLAKVFAKKALRQVCGRAS